MLLKPSGIRATVLLVLTPRLPRRANSELHIQAIPYGVKIPCLCGVTAAISSCLARAACLGSSCPVAAQSLPALPAFPDLGPPCGLSRASNANLPKERLDVSHIDSRRAHQITNGLDSMKHAGTSSRSSVYQRLLAKLCYRPAFPKGTGNRTLTHLRRLFPFPHHQMSRQFVAHKAGWPDSLLLQVRRRWAGTSRIRQV